MSSMTNNNYNTTSGGGLGGFWHDIAPTMRGEKPEEQTLADAVQARKEKVTKGMIIEGAQLDLKKTDPQFKNDFFKQLESERRMVEQSGKPLTTGGGGEYNPFKDPFKVTELAQKGRMGEMLGEASALENMTPTQRAFYKEQHSRGDQGGIPAQQTAGNGHADLTSNSERNRNAYDQRTGDSNK